jgi:hypothetical protein
MKTYSLILAICFVSSLDLASAWSISCYSPLADVVGLCEDLDVNAEYEDVMQKEATSLDLVDVGGRTRNLRGNNGRELPSGACTYCAYHNEKWCQSYPYNSCRRELEVVTITNGACVALLNTAKTDFQDELRGETNFQACEEALDTIKCECYTS